MKPIRCVDLKLLEKRRNEPCIACQHKPPSDPSHIRSRGAGGGDFEWNVVPMCRRCHSEWHQLGRVTFLTKYPRLKLWLNIHGWDLSDPFNWKHN